MSAHWLCLTERSCPTEGEAAQRKIKLCTRPHIGAIIRRVEEPGVKRLFALSDQLLARSEAAQREGEALSERLTTAIEESARLCREAEAMRESLKVCVRTDGGALSDV